MSNSLLGSNSQSSIMQSIASPLPYSSSLKHYRGPHFKAANSISSSSIHLFRAVSNSTQFKTNQLTLQSKAIKPMPISRGRQSNSVMHQNQIRPSGDLDPVAVLEQELTERISKVNSKGHAYISEVYEISRIAFQRVIEIDRTYGRILQLIKDNYEKFYESIVTDLPTYKSPKKVKSTPIKVAFEEPKRIKQRELPRKIIQKHVVPKISLPESNSVVGFHQEFLSHLEDFSMSWRNLLERHKKTN